MIEKTPKKTSIRTLVYVVLAVGSTLALSMGAGYINARLQRAHHQVATP